MERAFDASISSSIESTITAPACLKAAMYNLLDPARDPVWDATALSPASDLPTFSTITGFSVLFIALMSLLPSFTPSRYIAIAFVLSSSASTSRRSASSTSALFP